MQFVTCGHLLPVKAQFELGWSSTFTGQENLLCTSWLCCLFNWNWVGKVYHIYWPVEFTTLLWPCYLSNNLVEEVHLVYLRGFTMHLCACSLTITGEDLKSWVSAIIYKEPWLPGNWRLSSPGLWVSLTINLWPVTLELNLKGPPYLWIGKNCYEPLVVLLV